VQLRVETTIEMLRQALDGVRREGQRLGFVPTMGALHAGHARLIERARASSDVVVVSIFVNPLQFDRPDDLSRYPRPFEADLRLCEELGVDVVFAPSPAAMYPSPGASTVDPGPVAEHACGRFRPGHFRGVATVVTKLLNIVQPHVAFFGEKDAQQLVVVRRLVADLNLPVVVEGVATVREPDGLALSSRNAHLSPDERRVAPVLYAALRDAAASIARGVVDVDPLVAAASARIAGGGGTRLEYFEVVDPESFQPVTRVSGPVVIAAAMWVGTTRLIDNIRAQPG
jgi:pantoate--beta-alanine ligase